MGGNNRRQSMEQDYQYLTRVFDMKSEKHIYTLQDVFSAVNNWSMSPIDKQTIEQFLNILKRNNK
jgi:hypothetical protein